MERTVTHSHMCGLIMAWVWQMVSCLGSLLLLSHRASSAADGSRRCISRRRWDKLSLSFSWPPPPPPPPGQENKRTCAQAGGDASKRSLAPWRYKVDRDVDRIPPNMGFAECLCRGCVVNQREDLSYNSVPVTVQVTVLRRKQCPTNKHNKHNKHKYLLTIESIKVPVACMCVVPKSNK
ncbi:interleukin-17C-like [Solea senegalensis]|nr:interleukin-17C-like [Solea senegalensis]KAG7483473.1 interleukin-17C-like [Solea senegalensis]